MRHFSHNILSAVDWLSSILIYIMKNYTGIKRVRYGLDIHNIIIIKFWDQMSITVHYLRFLLENWSTHKCNYNFCNYRTGKGCNRRFFTTATLTRKFGLPCVSSNTFFNSVPFRLITVIMLFVSVCWLERLCINKRSLTLISFANCTCIY